MLIHSSQKEKNPEKEILLQQLTESKHFKKYLPGGYDSLPFGSIVGYCDIINCRPTEEIKNRIDFGIPFYLPAAMNLWINPEEEDSFGDFGPGRFFYQFTDIKEFKKPIQHVKGSVTLPWNHYFPGNDEDFIYQCQQCEFCFCVDQLLNDSDKYSAEEVDNIVFYCPCCKSAEVEIIIDNTGLPF